MGSASGTSQVRQTICTDLKNHTEQVLARRCFIPDRGLGGQVIITDDL